MHNHTIGISGITEIKQDVMDFGGLDKVFDTHNPDIIFHCVAITNVDLCEDEPENAYNYHVNLSHHIATYCNNHNIQMIYITTDQLWDGTSGMRAETDSLSPMNIYAKTKAESEFEVLKANSNALIIRTNFFGEGRPWRLSFSDWINSQLSQGQIIKGFDDIYYTPIAIPYLIEYIDQLVGKDAEGIYHVAGAERVSKYDFIHTYASMANLDKSLIEKASSSDGNLKANRPKDMSLDVTKVEEFLGVKMPNIEQSIKKILDVSKEKRKAS